MAEALSKKIHRLKERMKLTNVTVKAKSFICLKAVVGKTRTPKAPRTGRVSKQRRMFCINLFFWTRRLYGISHTMLPYFSCNQKKLKGKRSKMRESRDEPNEVVAKAKKAKTVVKLTNIINA